MKPGIVDPIIGLDVPSSNIPIKSKMVEMTPISNTNPQVSYHFVPSEGTPSRSHKWDKHIPDKKSLMALILSQCDEANREEFTLGQSNEYDMMAGVLLKFIKEMCKVCTNPKGKDVFSGLAYLSSPNTIFGQQQELKNYSPHIRTIFVFGITQTHVKYL